MLILTPMDPGDVVFCPAEYEILPGLDKELTIRWEAIPLRTDDPDQTNDSFDLVFKAAPIPVPALTPGGLVAFALALVGAFAVVRRRRL